MAHKKDVLKIIQWVFKINIYEIMFKGGIIPFILYILRLTFEDE